MTNDQLLLAIGLATLLVLLLLGFLLFILLWQRAKNNKFLLEKEMMQSKFNEQLFKSQLEIQEETFDFISMEIHDNVGQTLSLLKVQLNIVEQKEEFDRTLLAEIKNNVGKAIADLRDIAKSLSSERIQLSSLPELTFHELQRIEDSGIAITTLEVTGEEPGIRNDQKLILFRIIQECLQNIIKHAKASHIDIRFRHQSAHLAIEIKDDGQGFDAGGASSAGLGLKNIRSRTSVIGGDVQFSSVIGFGTTITIIIPYT